MQMYILSRQWGITLVSEQQMIGVQSQDMHAPGPDQPRRMHRKGVYGRIRRVEAQLGHGEGMVDSGLPCPSYPVRVDALGVPTSYCAQSRAASPCHRALCDSLLQCASFTYLRRDSSLACLRQSL